MPLDVIMPALGMAQDTGVILKWHKSPGDSVTEGDSLLEVETDKAAMDVEAQGTGYLTDVVAHAGDEVPVGKVLARISETPEDGGNPPEKPNGSPGASQEDNIEETDAGEEEIPDGEQVIMPALGMTQDAGLIVAWRKSPGEAVSANDILFEVETDKSVVEIEAGHDGFLAALLAQEGEEAPVGHLIAVISSKKPDSPVSRSLQSGGGASRQTAETAAEPATKPEPRQPAKQTLAKPPTAQKSVTASGRILASPKARRLALERGLDLAHLVEHGYPQPYHVKDLEVLQSLPQAAAARGTSAAASWTLSAEVSAKGFDEFAKWAALDAGLDDASALLAGFAGNSLGRKTATVALEAFGASRFYHVQGRRLGRVAEAETGAAPDLRLRDLRFSRLSAIQTGPEDTPVISVLAVGAGLKLTLECTPEQMDASRAINVLTEFAGRMEQPLRHLL